MTPRVFEPGEAGDLAGGVRYRVREGRKGPTDLILEMRGPSEFTFVSMDLGFLMADFFRQNEDGLYPPEYGFQGGGFYLRKVREATTRGWYPVVADLKAAKESRRRRTAAS